MNLLEGLVDSSPLAGILYPAGNFVEGLLRFLLGSYGGRGH